MRLTRSIVSKGGLITGWVNGEVYSQEGYDGWLITGRVNGEAYSQEGYDGWANNRTGKCGGL